MTEWCAGLPLRERRPLREEERGCLVKEQRRQRSKGIGIIAGYLLLLALFVVGAVAADPDAPVQQAALTVAIILLTAPGLAFTILIARDSFHRSRWIAADLRAGEVLHYAGRDEETGEEVWLEVLPGSRRIWAASTEDPNGIRRRWNRVEAVEVADTPRIATIAAQWLEPVSVDEEENTVSTGQREMSAEERKELERYTPRLWRRPLLPAIGFTLWLMMPIAKLLIDRHFDSKRDWFSFCMLAFAALASDYRLITGIAQARRLGQDRQMGRVVIVRFEAEQEEEETDGYEPADAVTVELLPVSRWVWTENSVPAGWRRLPLP